MSVSGVSGGMTIQQVTGGLDLEAFMMSVSAERANNLETQMAGQIQEIKERQEEIRELNQLLADVRALKGDGDGGDWQKLSSDVKARLEKAGCSVKTSGDDGQAGYVKNDDGQLKATNNTIDKWVEELKASLDNLNSTSQMDMIRLQSLSNKRNEAFEMLTNFVQKFASVNSSVIGNMR